MTPLSTHDDAEISRKPARPQRLDPVREAEAARALRESIAALADDEGLLVDTIEGETGLFECIDALVAARREARMMLTGLNDAIDGLESRKGRYERRIKAAGALIEQAMMIADLPKIERPTATLSLVTRQPKVEIATESDIPSQFWKASDPTLDKKALLAALKAGEAVPGCSLSNSAPTLTERML